MGRQDLAAVIAEMRKWASYKGDPSAWIPVGCTDNQRIREWAERLALLLAEARLQNDGQVQENQEVARVDAMGDSRDNPTASEHETTPATVTLNHVNNEPQAWRDIASAPADGTWVLGFDAEEMPQQEVVRWTEDIHGNTATWRCSEDYVRSPTHWMPLLAALPETSAQQDEKEKDLTRMDRLSTSSDASRTAATDVAEGERSTTPDQEINEVVHVTPELRAKLEEAMRHSEALRDVPYEMVGPRTFVAMKGKGVIIVRQHDSHGRRHSNFCELNVSPGIDAVAFAAEIVNALQVK